MCVAEQIVSCFGVMMPGLNHAWIASKSSLEGSVVMLVARHGFHACTSMAAVQ